MAVENNNHCQSYTPANLEEARVVFNNLPEADLIKSLKIARFLDGLLKDRSVFMGGSLNKVILEPFSGISDQTWAFVLFGLPCVSFGGNKANLKASRVVHHVTHSQRDGAEMILSAYNFYCRGGTNQEQFGAVYLNFENRKVPERMKGDVNIRAIPINADLVRMCFVMSKLVVVKIGDKFTVEQATQIVKENNISVDILTIDDDQKLAVFSESQVT